MQPPSLFNQLLETRFVAEGAALLAQLPWLQWQATRGTGPVMVLPGFLADDTSTALLRQFIAGLGYQVAGWQLGRNRGRMLDHLPPVTERVAAMADAAGEPVRLVGWSRGGVLAREIARDRQDLVRQVVTLASPVRGGPQATALRAMLQRETGLTPELLAQLLAQRQQRTINVPVSALYSKSDGVVAWQACIDPDPAVEHHEVSASHVGMGCNAQVFRLVARLLATDAPAATERSTQGL